MGSQDFFPNCGVVKQQQDPAIAEEDTNLRITNKTYNTCETFALSGLLNFYALTSTNYQLPHWAGQVSTTNYL